MVFLGNILIWLCILFGGIFPNKAVAKSFLVSTPNQSLGITKSKYSDDLATVILKKGDQTLVFSNKANGKFLRAEVVKAETSQFRKKTFFLNLKTNKYSRHFEEARPIEKLYKTDGVQGPSIRVGSDGLTCSSSKLATETISAVLEAANLGAGLDKYIGDSCKNPKDREKIAGALSQILTSYNGKGDRFISCLSKLGMSQYSLSLAMATAEQMEQENHKFINCGLGLDGNKLEFGSYLYLRNPGAGKTAHSIQLNMKEMKNSNQAEIAQVLFHEMLHMAGIAHEETAESIESCCSDKKDPRECQRAQTRVAKEKELQRAIEDFVVVDSGDFPILAQEVSSRTGYYSSERAFTERVENLDINGTVAEYKQCISDKKVEEFCVQIFKKNFQSDIQKGNDKCLLSYGQACSEIQKSFERYAESMGAKNCTSIAVEGNQNCLKLFYMGNVARTTRTGPQFNDDMTGFFGNLSDGDNLRKRTMTSSFLTVFGKSSVGDSNGWWTAFKAKVDANKAVGVVSEISPKIVDVMKKEKEKYDLCKQQTGFISCDSQFDTNIKKVVDGNFMKSCKKVSLEKDCQVFSNALQAEVVSALSPVGGFQNGRGCNITYANRSECTGAVLSKIQSCIENENSPKCGGSIFATADPKKANVKYFEEYPKQYIFDNREQLELFSKVETIPSSADLPTIQGIVLPRPDSSSLAAAKPVLFSAPAEDSSPSRIAHNDVEVENSLKVNGFVSNQSQVANQLEKSVSGLRPSNSNGGPIQDFETKENLGVPTEVNAFGATNGSSGSSSTYSYSKVTHNPTKFMALMAPTIAQASNGASFANPFNDGDSGISKAMVAVAASNQSEGDGPTKKPGKRSAAGADQGETFNSSLGGRGLNLGLGSNASGSVDRNISSGIEVSKGEILRLIKQDPAAVRKKVFDPEFKRVIQEQRILILNQQNRPYIPVSQPVIIYRENSKGVFELESGK